MKGLVATLTYGAITAVLLFGANCLAQDLKPGKLMVTVSPPQAYTFVDGNAIGPGERTIKVSVGSHHVVVANYGFKFFEQDISVDSDRVVPLDVTLVPSGGGIVGPRGRIQIEVGMMRVGDAAVLLNGKTPAYFVGHVDEFNNNLLSHQELVVPPGNHGLTVT